MRRYKTRSPKPGFIQGLRQFCLWIRHPVIKTSFKMIIQKITLLNCSKGPLSYWKSHYSIVEKKDLSGCIECSGIKLPLYQDYSIIADLSFIPFRFFCRNKTLINFYLFLFSFNEKNLTKKEKLLRRKRKYFQRCFPISILGFNKKYVKLHCVQLNTFSFYLLSFCHKL